MPIQYLWTQHRACPVVITNTRKRRQTVQLNGCIWICKPTRTHCWSAYRKLHFLVNNVFRTLVKRIRFCLSNEKCVVEIERITESYYSTQLLTQPRWPIWRFMQFVWGGIRLLMIFVTNSINPYSTAKIFTTNIVIENVTISIRVRALLFQWNVSDYTDLDWYRHVFDHDFLEAGLQFISIQQDDVSAKLFVKLADSGIIQWVTGSDGLYIENIDISFWSDQYRKFRNITISIFVNIQVDLSYLKLSFRNLIIYCCVLHRKTIHDQWTIHEWGGGEEHH